MTYENWSWKVLSKYEKLFNCVIVVARRLKRADRSFTHHAPVLRNNCLHVPRELRYPVCHTLSTNLSGSTNHILALSTSQFHSRVETYLFQQSFLL